MAIVLASVWRRLSSIRNSMQKYSRAVVCLSQKYMTRIYLYRKDLSSYHDGKTESNDLKDLLVMDVTKKYNSVSKRLVL
jgi:hypothetical protein